MRRHALIPLTVAGALVTAALTVAAPQNAAAVTCKFGPVKISPTTVVVGTTINKKVTLSVTASGCAEEYALGYWELESDGVFLDENASSTKFTGSHVFKPHEMYNSWAGTWKSYLDWSGSSEVELQSKATQSIRVVRATRLTLNAHPEPIRKGKNLTVDGTLKRANWESGHYDWYGSQKVKVQFKSTGGTYKTVKTISSGRGVTAGGLYTKIKATKTGCYRLVYTGNSTSAGAASIGDCVKVTK